MLQAVLCQRRSLWTNPACTAMEGHASAQGPGLHSQGTGLPRCSCRVTVMNKPTSLTWHTQVPSALHECAPCEERRGHATGHELRWLLLIRCEASHASAADHRLQVDTIGVLLRHAWGLRRMHKPSTACSEKVDRLQLSRVHAPGVAEEAPLLDGLVHSQIRLEAPAGRPQACQGQVAAGSMKMQCCLKVAEWSLHVTGQ